MEGDDLELDSEGDTTAGSSSHLVRKNIAIKLKPSPKSRVTKPRKVVKPKTSAMEREYEDDFIPEAPLFKTMEPLEPVHHEQRLRWDHRVNLIGEKVVDPVIHCCEKCTLPILIYGRMIPCKHVFCLDCAKKTEKSCARCEEPVQRVEQSALGTVFVCIYGGTKLGVSGCRRTYLSQRDLQAHVDHRHLKRGLQEHNKPHTHPPAAPVQEYVTAAPHPIPMELHRQVPLPAIPDPGLYQRPPPDPLRLPPPVLATSHPPPPVQHHQIPPQGLPQTHLPPPAHQAHHLPGMPPLHTQPPLQQQQQPPPTSRDNYAAASIPVMTSNRGNLISVPIQDERTEYRADYQSQPPPNYGHLAATAPPPVSFPPTQPPPAHHPPPVHYSATTMTAPPHQPQPVSFASPLPISHGPPPHYSAPQVSKPGIPPPASHPPPHHSVPPPLAHLQPPRPGAPAAGPLTSTPIAHHPRPGAPLPRMGPPVSQPHHGAPPPRFTSSHPHYEDSPATPPYGQSGGQSPRLPWTGPPTRLPPPHTPVSSAPPNLVPPQPRPGGEGPYKQYY